MATPFHQLFQRLFGSGRGKNAKNTPDGASQARSSATDSSSEVIPPIQPSSTNTNKDTINLPGGNLPDIIPSRITGSATKYAVWQPAIPIDTLFFDWIMGSPGESSVAELEHKVLQALYGLLAADLNEAVVVPRMPSIIPQLLASLRNKSVNVQELTRLIVKDVVLVGEVINAVNSAVYNPADRISSLDKAVLMLGEDGLRFVIAKVAFRPIINLSAGPYTRRAAPHIWLQSEKCALACHTLSETGDHAFQAFLTGLMKNVGLIIAFRILDQECEQAKFRYSASFQYAMNAVAATLSYRIAQRWEFPPEVVQALQQQVGGKKTEWSALGQLLHDADLISKMRVLVNQAQLSRNDQQLKAGLSPKMAECFDHLNTLHTYELRTVTTSR